MLCAAAKGLARSHSAATTLSWRAARAVTSNAASRSHAHAQFSTSAAACMAGHNKWSKIRHKKGAADLRRALTFAKLGKEIIATAKGNADPASNPALAALIAKGRLISMPKSTIEAALAKAQGGYSANLTAVTYGGTALGASMMFEVLTDNTNRASKEIKAALAKYGGAMSEVGFMFAHKGVITASLPDGTDKNAYFEKLLEDAIEHGAEDVEPVETTAEEGAAADGPVEYSVFVPFTSMFQIANELKKRGHNITSIEPTWVALDEYKTTCEGEAAEHMEKLLQKIDECDDVMRVHTNLAE